MAKQGMHKHDAHDPRISAGHNNPKKSTPITTGTPKKHSTYEKQAAQHEDTGKQAQYAKNEWHPDTRDAVTHEADSEAQAMDRTERSGSDSNEDRSTRGH